MHALVAGPVASPLRPAVAGQGLLRWVGAAGLGDHVVLQVVLRRLHVPVGVAPTHKCVGCTLLMRAFANIAVSCILTFAGLNIDYIMHALIIAQMEISAVNTTPFVEVLTCTGHQHE